MTADSPSVGYVLDPADNVATLPWGGAEGARITLRGRPDAGQGAVTLGEAILPGHKVSLADIPAGASVLKYGLPIGKARMSIPAGALVHVANVASRFSPDGIEQEAQIAPTARIRLQDLRRTLERILVFAGAGAEAARDTAEHCAAAEARGVVTHGLRRVRAIVGRLRAGGIRGDASPVIERSGGLLFVDGRAGLGHHVARVSTDAVMHAARDNGIAAALVRNSSHFGYAGHYTSHLARNGLVGLAVSNGQVLVGPPGGRRAIFSNNPLALSAPIGADGLFEFDMATSVTSRARIAEAAELGGEIAPGIAQDADGLPTVDPVKALKGLLLPLGGHKGFGLIAALEVLAGVLPGGSYADQVVSKEGAPGEPEGTSHCIIAISLEAVGREAAFRDRMADFKARIEALPMADGAAAARLPGARREAIAARTGRDGVPMNEKTLADLRELAAEAGAELRLLQGESS